MTDPKKFISNYKDQLIKLINNIDPVSIEQTINELKNAEKNNNKIFVIGNGGSAATASHMANDFGIGLKRRKLLNIDVESLSDNSSVCTAIANDTGYENIFYLQLLDKIKPNDLLIAISCSGNSPNIIKAVKHAKEQNIKIIGLTGFDGGELKKLSDINFHIETQKYAYGLVEDLHMIFDHIIYSYFINDGDNDGE